MELSPYLTKRGASDYRRPGRRPGNGAGEEANSNAPTSQLADRGAGRL